MTSDNDGYVWDLLQFIDQTDDNQQRMVLDILRNRLNKFTRMFYAFITESERYWAVFMLLQYPLIPKEYLTGILTIPVFLSKDIDYLLNKFLNTVKEKVNKERF